MIRLSDEELEKLLDIDFKNAFSGHIEEYQAITKASLKKVVKWLTEKGYKKGVERLDGSWSDAQMFIKWEDWQSLLKEIE